MRNCLFRQLPCTHTTMLVYHLTSHILSQFKYLFSHLKMMSWGHRNVVSMSISFANFYNYNLPVKKGWDKVQFNNPLDWTWCIYTQLTKSRGFLTKRGRGFLTSSRGFLGNKLAPFSLWLSSLKAPMFLLYQDHWWCLKWLIMCSPQTTQQGLGKQVFL